jgi:hypothetical protein
MEPVSTAIIAALGMLTEKVVQDAYCSLKSLLVKKFGNSSELVSTADGLEKNPDSAGRRATLKEELAAANADDDADIVAAAQALIEAIKSQPGGEQTINQTVTGDHNIFSGSGNVTINRS